MRSRPVNTPSEKLLICGFGAADSEKFSRLCARLGCEAVTVPEDSGREQVGYLAGCAGFAAGFSESGEKAPAGGSCIIFSGFTDKRLDKALSEIRRAFPDGIPLKAVVTAANQKMTLAELISELKREHEALNS